MNYVAFLRLSAVASVAAAATYDGATLAGSVLDPSYSQIRQPVSDLTATGAVPAAALRIFDALHPLGGSADALRPGRWRKTRNWKIDDPWDDVVKYLNGSYGAMSISKTIIVRALKPAAKPAVPAVARAPVVTAPPVPVVITPPEPMALYSFRPEPTDDLRPRDQVATLAEAKSQADAYALTHPH